MTGILDIFEYANDASGSIFGIGVLISWYAIIFMYLNGKGEDPTDCFIVSGFLTSITGVFFFLAGLITGWQLFMLFMVCVLAGLWSYYRKSG